MKGKEAKENQGDDCRQVFLILSFNYGHRIDADHIHTMQFTTIISVDVSKCNAIWRLQPCRPQNAMQFGDRSGAGFKMQCNLATAAVQASKCSAIWRLQPCRPQNAMQFGDRSGAGLKMQCNLATAAVQASKCNAIWRPQPCRPQNAMQFGDCSGAEPKMQCNSVTAAMQTPNARRFEEIRSPKSPL